MDARPTRFDGRGQAAESAARAAAERFLNYRDSGDYQAAWRQFTAENQVRSPEPRWTQRAEQWTKKYGQAANHTIDSFVLDSGGMYTCMVSSAYEHNLSSQEKIVVAEERSGRWAIVSATRTPPE
jgi:predicted  nucleic acid-binding Zn-ribbon protein